MEQRRGEVSAGSAPHLSIRRGREDDLKTIVEIYNDTVVNSAATFDLRPVTVSRRRRWLREHDRDHPLLVLEADGRVVGYATLSPFRDKPAYSKSVEVSIYVSGDYRGRGIGTKLMEAIIQRAADLGYHTIVSAVVPPNEASVALHRRFGFKPVGRFSEVGFKFGRWQHVDFFQLLLE